MQNVANDCTIMEGCHVGYSYTIQSEPKKEHVALVIGFWT